MKLIVPPQIDDQVIRFARIALKGVPEWVEVEPLEGSLQTECFDNVDRAIRTHGGKAIMGWIIWEKPGAWLEAEHHAIWEQQDGTWRDVTPTVDGEPRLVFVPDDKAVRSHPRFGLPTRYVSISKDLVAVNAIKKAQKMMEVRAEILAAGGISPELMPKAQLAHERFVKALEAIDAKLAAQAKAEDDDTPE
ncbi:MAG: hypothetical protein J7530_20170 [Novosphingobium sp.]|nr:hypothetical protein [Novosphingobium sp.]